MEVFSCTVELEVTPSAGALYSVYTVHYGSPSETQSFKPVMRETGLACFARSPCAPEASPDLGNMSLGWLRKLLRLEHALLSHYAVPEPEAGDATVLDDEHKEAVVYRNSLASGAEYK